MYTIVVGQKFRVVRIGVEIDVLHTEVETQINLVVPVGGNIEVVVLDAAPLYALVVVIVGHGGVVACEFACRVVGRRNHLCLETSVG